MSRSVRLATLRPDLAVKRLIELLGPTGSAARQGLAALTANALTSLVAGLLLIGFEPTWRAHAPLIVLIPAAIGLRGNVFSTLGSRLSTSIHMGTFKITLARDSVLGQNLIAAFTLTFAMSTLLGVFAKVFALGLGIEHSMTLGQIIAVSVIGGFIGSVVVAGAAVILTLGAVRFGWDLDNLVAPSISTLGDVITIPAIWLAAQMLDDGVVLTTVGLALGVASIGLTVAVLRSKVQQLACTITKESLPVLSAGIVLSGFAGVVIQKQSNLLSMVPAVWAMQPAVLSGVGALGGIMCGRVATNLHIGSVEPTLSPSAQTRRDASLILSLAVPITILNAVGGVVVARLVNNNTYPGLWWTLAISACAFALTTLFVIALAYYSTIGAWRLNVDPDSYGVPVVTAAVDFIGTVALVVAVVAFGLTG